MSDFRLTAKGFRELREAVRRNPGVVTREVGKFLVRGIAAYNRTIIRAPWRLGTSGGGAPVDTGNLRDTHRREIETWRARIYTNTPYAGYVHDGTRRMKARPWLDYAKEKNENEIARLESDMLNAIVKDLAR